MKQSRIAVLTLVAALSTTPVMFAADQSAEQAALQKEAKITMAQARKTALQKAHGPVESAELERENGKLIYSFDIRTSKKVITEVAVDAIDGSIVSVTKETPKKEAAEKKLEAQEKAKAGKH